METKWQINKIFHTFQYIYHVSSLSVSNYDLLAEDPFLKNIPDFSTF